MVYLMVTGGKAKLCSEKGQFWVAGRKYVKFGARIVHLEG